MALGAAIDLSGVSLPFTVQDLLSSATSVLTWVSPFVLLGVAIAFAPRLIGFIKSVLPGGKKA
ncbi:hypothetical protein [Anoxybacteroides amylolyticum]|uniref:Uncharacterized protein n=1 Tax=Anoxybacteroides amylolyticum TaxID=294699 RepID=A0A167T3V3_9BACL|nr:hypothetical protein [Anoxybacillus amylolyticus]ANB59408.1 hypothetical protein GFC30_2749 [Anoxybacillus amylolyticus]